MSYFMYNRLVTFAKHSAVNKKDGAGSEPGTTENSNDSDDYPVSDRPPVRRSERHFFVKGHRPGFSQYMRQEPKMLNIMTEPCLEEANPECFGRLLLVLFKPFFVVTDLFPPHATCWYEVCRSTSECEWDPKDKAVASKCCERADGEACGKYHASKEGSRRCIGRYFFRWQIRPG